VTTPDRVQTLIVKVDKLAIAVRDLAGKLHITRRFLIVTAVSVALDLALSGLFIAQHVGQNAINAREDCTNTQRQALTALSTADQDANRQFYLDLIAAGASREKVETAIGTLFAKDDSDLALRRKIVANTRAVFTLPATNFSFPKPVSFTVEPC
jgi:hypothetical protein